MLHYENVKENSCVKIMLQCYFIYINNTFNAANNSLDVK